MISWWLHCTTNWKIVFSECSKWYSWESENLKLLSSKTSLGAGESRDQRFAPFVQRQKASRAVLVLIFRRFLAEVKVMQNYIWFHNERNLDCTSYFIIILYIEIFSTEPFNIQKSMTLGCAKNALRLAVHLQRMLLKCKSVRRWWRE